MTRLVGKAGRRYGVGFSIPVQAELRLPPCFLCCASWVTKASVHTVRFRPPPPSSHKGYRDANGKPNVSDTMHSALLCQADLRRERGMSAKA